MATRSKKPSRKAVKKAPAKKKAKKAPAKKKKKAVKKKVAKKAPAKKKVKRKAPISPTAEKLREIIDDPGPKKRGKPHPTTSGYEPPDDDDETHGKLKFLAETQYTMDLDGCTIEQLGQRPLFAGVKLHTLQRWCTEGHWVDQRREIMERWKRAIENKIGSELVKNMASDFRRMRTIYDRILTKLEVDDINPKSWEGLVDRAIRLGDVMMEWGDKVSRLMVPDALASPTTGVPQLHGHETRPDISPQEAQLASRTILQERSRKRAAQVAREESGGKLTRLQVVDGGELG